MTTVFDRNSSSLFSPLQYYKIPLGSTEKKKVEEESDGTPKKIHSNLRGVILEDDGEDDAIHRGSTVRRDDDDPPVLHEVSRGGGFHHPAAAEQDVPSSDIRGHLLGSLQSR